MKLHVDYFNKNMKDSIPIESFYSIPLIFSLRLDAYDFSIVLFAVVKRIISRLYTKDLIYF